MSRTVGSIPAFASARPPIGAPPSRRQDTAGLRRKRALWRHLFRHTGAALGAGVFACLVALAIVGPLLSPFDPARLSLERLQPPSWSHPLGTDQLGRDLLTRLLYGARISMQVAVVAVAIGS